MTEATVKEVATAAALNVISRPDLILSLQLDAVKLKSEQAYFEDLIAVYEEPIDHAVAFDTTLTNEPKRKAAAATMKRNHDDIQRYADNLKTVRKELLQLQARLDHLKQLQQGDLPLLAYVAVIHG